MLLPVHSPTRGKALNNTFQTIDPLFDLKGVQNYSWIYWMGRYFDEITRVQRESPIVNLQIFLPVRDWKKRWISLIPHPPNSFGATTKDHFTRWGPFFCPFHRNHEQILCIFFSTVLGTITMEFQYIGIPWSTDFSSTNMPPLDRRRWTQSEVLDSTLRMKKLQFVTL